MDGYKLLFGLEVMLSDLSGEPDKASCYRDFNSSPFLVGIAVCPGHSQQSFLEFLTPSQPIPLWSGSVFLPTPILHVSPSVCLCVHVSLSSCLHPSPESLLRYMFRKYVLVLEKLITGYLFSINPLVT